MKTINPLFRAWIISSIAIYFFLLLFGEQNYFPLAWWECFAPAIVVPPILYAAYVGYREAIE